MSSERVTLFKRRVQKLGGSSLIITLPKQWINKMNINAGDVLVVVDEGEYLKIIPENFSPPVRSLSVSINSLPKDDEEKVRFIKCAYGHGYDRVTVFTENTRNGGVALFKNGEILDRMAKELPISKISVSSNAVLIEFSRDSDDSINPSLKLKLYSGALNAVLDNIAKGRIDNAEEDLAKLYSLSLDIARSSVRKSLGFSCETSRLTYISGFFLALAETISLLTDYLSSGRRLSRKDIDLLEDTRSLLLETLGSLATGSVKRVEHAKEAAEKLREVLVSNGENISTPVYSLSVNAVSLVRTVAELSLCKLKEKEQGDLVGIRVK
ncbi:hypothetical protein APE_0088.1 [Aeropyrum pernix K1]|uniref:SpoVT-AbrB domain-containing protein n=1 Tax=Aeropyrum pernix (strain ATCC 700893 / DSM 11879 / JCM 9820 / NBRC 100138 / K1) TaxID=272557 RepID=Q9YG13_AERPE|nr:AbrB/MazE/SpoVT family DNA-binding domain-containing protein [Aeropyrum pernix]BAA78997.2 hypothetical protein APE_0088.1 [Aeropyrum pernix K1]